MVSFEVLFQHCLEGLRKTLIQNSGSLNQDLEQDLTDTKQKCYPFYCHIQQSSYSGRGTCYLLDVSPFHVPAFRRQT